MNEKLSLSVCITKKIPFKYVKQLVPKFKNQGLTFGVLRISGSNGYRYELWREPKSDEEIRGSGNHGEVKYGQIIDPNPPAIEKFWHVWVKGQITR